MTLVSPPAAAVSPCARMRQEHAFVLALFGADGHALAEFRITPDFMPALEWTALTGLRCDRRLSAIAATSAGCIEPIFDSVHGAPRLAAFRARVPSPRVGVPDLEMDFHPLYFTELAQVAASQLVNDGSLKVGDTFVFEARAYHVDTGDQCRGGFAVEEQPHPLELLPVSIRDLAASAEAIGTPNDQDIPVFIPAETLAETAVRARAHPAEETGGLLIGRLCRDVDSSEIAVLITAQVPAVGTAATATRLRFTPETWTAANDAITLRRKNELMLGWWHSHPVGAWRAMDGAAAAQPGPDRPGGDEGKIRTVARSSGGKVSGFFSASDAHVHRSVFGRAYQTALVVTDAAEDGLDWTLFGWRWGLLVSRGFHVLRGGDESCRTGGD